MARDTNDGLDARMLSRLGETFHTQMRNQTAALENALAARDAELERERMERHALRVELARIKEQITTIKNELEHGRAERDVLQAGLARVDIRISAIDNEQRQTAEQVMSLRTKLRNEISHTRNEVVGITKQLRAQEASILTLLSDQNLPDSEIEPEKAAVHWLSQHGEAAMLSNGPSAGFEIAATMLWPGDAFLRASYRWLLGRDADESGLASYRTRLHNGLTRWDLLRELAISDEASARLRGDLIHADDDLEYISHACDLLLGRPADSGGIDYYMSRIDRQNGRQRVLLDIARSSEARTLGDPVAAALRSIAHVRTMSARLRHALNRVIFYPNSSKRHIWLTTRLIEIEALARCDREALQVRLDAIRHGAAIALAQNGSLHQPA